MSRRPAWPLVLPLTGCLAAPPAATGLSGGGSTGDDGPSTGAAASTSAAASDSDAGTGTDTTTSAGDAPASAGDPDAPYRSPVIDVGVDTEGVDTVPAGCHGKIDFVFLISRSESMQPHQDALLASIPELLAVIEGDLAAYDPHVMVIDGDKSWGDDAKCTQATCPADGGCAAIGAPDYPCWALHDDEALTTCDRTHGAGVIFPAARGAANKPCEFLPGRRYLSRDDPDLASAFACAAQVGATDVDMMISKGLFNAFTPGLNGPDGCNAGFLRDDALLVLTIIHGRNERWGGAFLQPLGWANQVLAAKGNDRDAIIALGILPDNVEGVDAPLCKGEADKGGEVHEFLGYLDHAFTYPVCAESYGEGFAQAAARVHEICDGVSR